MEILFAAAALLLAVIYGIVIIVGVEKRQAWAIELSRVLSLMHGHPIETRKFEQPALEELSELQPVNDEELTPKDRLVA